MHRLRPTSAAFAIGILLLILGWGALNQASPKEHTIQPTLEVVSKMTVHYIDVGQGDATLLQGPDFTILIDAGRHDRSDVVPYLRSAGITSLDLIIGTHPHADHIGQMDRVIAAFPVKEAWLSGDSHTSKTFERVLDAILDSPADYHEPKAGELFQFGSLSLEVLNPGRLTGDLHEGSIAVRAVYGQVAFLFTGDAEEQTEQAMVQRGHAPTAQILQLGHHGSRTSSTALFLGAVRPAVAIYSAEADNSYGHPHAEVIDRLASLQIPVYGTDCHGTIKVRTDGSTYELLLSKQGQARAPPRAGWLSVGGGRAWNGL